MRQVFEIAAVISMLAFALALFNFILRWLNQIWIGKIPGKPGWVSGYQSGMRWFSRYHRWFGITALVALLVHSLIGIVNGWLPPSGWLAASGVLLVGMFGVYKTYLDKKLNPRLFLTIHRILAVVAIIAILYHDWQMELAARRRGTVSGESNPIVLQTPVAEIGEP